MSKARNWLSLLIMALLGLLGWQHHDRQRLRANQAEMLASVVELEALRDELARLRKERMDPEDLKRQQDNLSELVRLRGQVGQLRRELQEAKAAVSAAAQSGARSSLPAAATNNSPGEAFASSAKATVGRLQSMIMGGWTLPSGKRAYVFLEPSADQVENTVAVRVRVAELPGWLQDANLAIVQGEDAAGVLSASQSQALQATLANTDGVAWIAAPQVVTLNGRQAQVSVTESHAAPDGQTYLTGPVIDVTPTIGLDGQSVELTVSAQLHVPRHSSAP